MDLVRLTLDSAPMLEWTETDAAYIAGIIDGEGTIGIYYHKRRDKNERTWRIQITVVNTDQELMKWLSGMLHANVLKVHRQKPTAEWRSRKECYTLTVDRLKARKVLERIFPYLRIKKKQGELALAFHNWQHDAEREWRHGRGYNAASLTTCETYVQQMHILNGYRKEDL